MMRGSEGTPEAAIWFWIVGADFAALAVIALIRWVIGMPIFVGN